MRPTFDEHCLKLKARAEHLALEADMRASVDHLRTFNFGQPDQRLEDARYGL